MSYTYIEEEWRDAIMGKDKGDWEKIAHTMKSVAEQAYEKGVERSSELLEEANHRIEELEDEAAPGTNADSVLQTKVTDQEAVIRKLRRDVTQLRTTASQGAGEHTQPRHPPMPPHAVTAGTPVTRAITDPQTGGSRSQ